jgi:hypothetical protein
MALTASKTATCSIAWAREFAEFTSCFSEPIASAFAFQSMMTSALAGMAGSATVKTAARKNDFMKTSLPALMAGPA